MKYKKLLPVEVIENAIHGDPDAVDTVLKYYAGYIRHLSSRQGYINPEVVDQLKERLLWSITMKFDLDK